MAAIGKVCILFGGILVVLGVLLCLVEKAGWTGHLPGGFIYRKGNVSVCFPFVTCAVLSIVVSLIIWIISKFR